MRCQEHHRLGPGALRKRRPTPWLGSVIRGSMSIVGVCLAGPRGSLKRHQLHSSRPGDADTKPRKVGPTWSKPKHSLRCLFFVAPSDTLASDAHSLPESRGTERRTSPPYSTGPHNPKITYITQKGGGNHEGGRGEGAYRVGPRHQGFSPLNRVDAHGSLMCAFYSVQYYDMLRWTLHADRLQGRYYACKKKNCWGINLQRALFGGRRHGMVAAPASIGST